MSFVAKGWRSARVSGTLICDASSMTDAYPLLQSLCSISGRPLSSAPDLGTELESFAERMKQKIDSRKQKDRDDVKDHYRSLLDRAATRKAKGRKLTKLDAQAGEFFGLKLDYEEPRTYEDYNRDVKPGRRGEGDGGEGWRADVKRIMQENFDDIDAAAESNVGDPFEAVEKRLDELTKQRELEEGSDADVVAIESEMESSYKNTITDMIVRDALGASRYKEDNQGKVMSLPVTELGPKMRPRAEVKIDRDAPPITFEALNPNFHDSEVGKLMCELGLAGDKLYRLSERNPRAFIRSRTEVEDILDYFRNMLKMTDGELIKLMFRYPQFLSKTKDALETGVEYVRTSLKYNRADLKRIIMGCPECMEPNFEKDFMEGVNCLQGESGLGINSVRLLAVQYPLTLRDLTKNNVTNLFGFLRTRYDFRREHLVQALKTAPELLSGSLESYIRTCVWFLKHGFSNEDFRLLIKTHPGVVGYNLDKCIIPVLHWFYNELSCKQPHVLRMIQKWPGIMLLPVGHLNMNVRELLSLRFSMEEIRKMVTSCPLLMKQDLGSPTVDNKVKYLVKELKRPPPVLCTFPDYLTFAFEDRIIARVEFLKHVGRLDYMSWPLDKLYADPDDKFCVDKAHKPSERFAEFLSDNWPGIKDTIMMQYAGMQRRSDVFVK